MSNYIELKKGLAIPISGEATLNVTKTKVPDTVAIQPSDFKGFLPRLLVKEGDRVLAGSPVLADKTHPEILLTAPVSGVVSEIVRGEKRKLLAVVIKTDSKMEYVDFGAKKSADLSASEIKETLLNSGLWPSLVQRPYGVIADPDATPKAVFVSAFKTAPLAADLEFTLGDQIPAIQEGINALGKLTGTKVHVSVNACDFENSPFHRLTNAEIHQFKGKHPAGNVGVQISHIDPIRKDETVWTVSPVLLAAIGKLFLNGRVELKRKVAVTGPKALDYGYIETFPGTPVDYIHEFYGNSTDARIVSGDPLSGKTIGFNGYLGFFDDQITILQEGTDTELFGWARPFRFNQFSATRSYFSRFVFWKKYDMDTNLHGGPRAFVMSDSYYADVLPMDIFPTYLIKACLAGDIDKMEKYGIYEVLPEDFATCEFIDPSKNNIQDIVAGGIDLMLKEMA